MVIETRTAPITLATVLGTDHDMALTNNAVKRHIRCVVRNKMILAFICKLNSQIGGVVGLYLPSIKEDKRGKDSINYS